ncbi:MAG TPA: cysteine desulfurase family protein [Thermoanaerobaculia bacterium]
MIYLDNNASTEPDPEVLAAVEEATRLFGNPSSVHAEGRRARRAIEEARSEVAALVNARPEEIFFTSGGTESNALAIFGSVSGRSGRIVLSGAEHPSVREPVGQLGRTNAFEILTVNPEPSGALDEEKVLDAATDETALVSLMSANNEYGAVFPVARLAPELRARGALVHTDAVQAAGKIPVDVRAWNVDLLSCSAHKLHGPKGVGALFVRKGLAIAPHTPGGGQERKIRAGTENTSGIAGFGVAARLARERIAEAAAIGKLRDRFESVVRKGIPGAKIVGESAPRLTNTSAILFPGVSGETLVASLDLEGVAVSVGSACSSGTTSPSPAILALGLPASEARRVVRFSLSRLTTAAEIDRVAELLPALVAGARHAGAAEAALTR